MAGVVTFERATRVDAPFDRTWAFHTRTDGLMTVTPDLAGLRIRQLTWPDGTADESLSEGAEIDLALSPLGVGPVLTWTARIVEVHEREGRGCMVDEMVEGPLQTWRHEHHVRAIQGGSEVRDRVTFTTGLGWPVDRVVAAALVPAFVDRHRRTRKALETH